MQKMVTNHIRILYGKDLEIYAMLNIFTRLLIKILETNLI